MEIKETVIAPLITRESAPSAPATNDPILEILEETKRKFVSGELAWVQNTSSTGPGSACLSFAIQNHFGGYGSALQLADMWEAHQRVQDKATSIGFKSIPDFNDVQGRTLEDIIAILDSAINTRRKEVSLT